MKKIGLVGGLSCQSTAEYYRLIVERSNAILGKTNTVQMIIYSLNPEEFINLFEQNDWDTITHLLTEAALALERAGADFILISCNTIHKISDQIKKSLSVPFLDILEILCMHLRSNHIKNVGLLGTRYTLEDDYYRNYLSKYQIKASIPSAEDRVILHDIIFNELSKGKVTIESKRKVLNMIKQLQKDQGAEAVALSCTELSLLISDYDNVPIPVFDTTQLHTHAAVDYALSQLFASVKEDLTVLAE